MSVDAPVQAKSNAVFFFNFFFRRFLVRSVTLEAISENTPQYFVCVCVLISLLLK